MAASWAPSVEQVHAVIFTRGGGTFGPATRPTSVQVVEIVDQLATELVGEVGSFDPSAVIPGFVGSPGDVVTLGELARRTAVLGSALQVEDAFFPEHGDSSRGDRLLTQYLTALKRLRQAVDDVAAAVEGGDGVAGLGTIGFDRGLLATEHTSAGLGLLPEQLV